MMKFNTKSCNMIFILFSFHIINIFSFKCDHVIKTNGTKIIGRKLYTVFENKPYAAFWKIPYAQPPVDRLRFKPTIHRPWLDKAFYNYSVPYYDTGASYHTEDCLYISIFTPITEKTLYFPIIVWVDEDSSALGPDFFIDEKVIVVTISFRTSILGFFNTGDTFSEGNMGAKDIVEALKWIRNNIIYFNGDINRVTVFGSGASANIVASLLLSPASEDLFVRAIVEDGSALTPADYRDCNFEICNKLYRKLNGPYEKFNRTHLYEILEKICIEQLLLASQDLYDSSEVRDSQRLIRSFGPTVEKSKTAFMNEIPSEIYKRKNVYNDVSVMIGYTNLNSLHKLDGFVNKKILLKHLNYNFQYLLPFEGRRVEYGSKMYKKIRRKIMDFYFINGTIGERSLRRYAKYLSDQVIYPVLRQAKLHAKVSCNNVYLYRFAYKGSLNRIWISLLRNLSWSGATEGDVTCYQFNCKSLRHVYDTEAPDEKLLIKKIARLFANFVKYGNPTPGVTDHILGDLQWTPLNSDGNKSMRGLNFGNKVKMITVPEKIRVKFWDQLRNEYFAEII